MHRKLEFWIITSTEDIASMNIRTHLMENYPFKQTSEEERWVTWENHPTYLLEQSSSENANIRLVLTDKGMVFLGDKES